MIRNVLVKIYRLLPLIVVFDIVKKIYVPSFYKYLTVNGVFKLKLSDDNSFKLQVNHNLYIEKELFWKGVTSEFEPKTLQLWQSLSAESDLIMDLGANTGVFSLIAAATNNIAIIYSFEPVPYNYKILQKNIDLNDFSNINLVTKAVSETIDKHKMLIEENSVNYINSLENDKLGNNQNTMQIEIESIDIDTFCNNNSIEAIDLIKIDVEGHELKVLNGMKRIINDCKPTFIIEVLHESMANDLNIFFNDLNYNYFLIDDTNMQLVRKDKIQTANRVNYLISIKEF